MASRRRKGPPASDRTADEAMERRIASRELGKAKRAIQTLRTFFIVNAVLWGIPFLLLLIVPGAQSLKLFLFAGLGVMCWGCIDVKEKPVVWGVVIASFWTILSALRIYAGQDLFSIWGITTYLWTLGCWALVPATVRAKQLIAEYPDLWVSKQIRPGGRARRTGRDAPRRRR